MNRRFSTYIEHKVRHHTHKMTTHITSLFKEKGKIILILVLLLIVVGAIGVRYEYERRAAQTQDPLQPIACTQLLFDNNKERCSTILFDFYKNRAPLEREPLCKNKSFYGGAAVLCEEYDEVRSKNLYGNVLNEYGISIWEPNDPVLSNGTLRVRSTSTINTMYLVCDKTILPIQWSSNEDKARATITLDHKINSTCQLIAKVSGGSVTSKAFVVIMQ